MQRDIGWLGLLEYLETLVWIFRVFRSTVGLRLLIVYNVKRVFASSLVSGGGSDIAGWFEE